MDTLYNPTAKDTGEKWAVWDGNVAVTCEGNPLPMKIPLEEPTNLVKLHSMAATSEIWDTKSLQR